MTRWAAQKNLGPADIAHHLGVPISLYRKWLAEHPELQTAFFHGARTADAEVVQALHHRAVGYDYEFSTTTVTRQKHNGKTTTTETLTKFKKHLPPEAHSIRYWLNNRLPDQWSETQKRNPAIPIIARIRRIPLALPERRDPL
jgi:hypothetical protein